MITEEMSTMLWNKSNGLWINALYKIIKIHYPEKDNKYLKDIFIGVVEKWLEEDKLRFLNPDRFAVLKNAEKAKQFPLYWNATPKDIVKEIAEDWPSDEEIAEDEFNMDLFFYSIPNAIWVQPDGDEIYSS